MNRSVNRSQVPDHWNFEENRLGQLLLRFRKRNGWAGQTAEDWAAVCPELWPVRIGNSVWTNIETGRSRVPALVTFEALGQMNALLASDYRGRIPPGLLRQRVYDAEPIVGDDGRPWNHHDFIDLYLNQIELPEAYKGADGSERSMSAEDAAEATEHIRLGFREFLKSCHLRPQAAMNLVLQAAGPLSSEDERTAESVLFGLSGLTPGQRELIQSLLSALSTIQCDAESDESLAAYGSRAERRTEAVA
jgi:hypothetical protein